jgi:hypothetical protein
MPQPLKTYDQFGIATFLLRIVAKIFYIWKKRGVKSPIKLSDPTTRDEKSAYFKC